jgi:hypothetical protein
VTDETQCPEKHRQHNKLYNDTEYNQIIQILEHCHTNKYQDPVPGLPLEQGVLESSGAEEKVGCRTIYVNRPVCKCMQFQQSWQSGK